MKRQICVLIAALAFTIPLHAQTETPTPGPTPTSRAEQLEEHKRLIEKETALLKARREYLEEFGKASGQAGITRESSGGKTTYASEDKPILETVSLSYEAVGELSTAVEQRLRPFVSGYDRLIFYHEPDFQALSRYRLYREQARMALANYEALVKAINEEAVRRNDKKAFGVESVDRSPGGALITGLGMPSVAGAAFKSVAELVSLFRTDRTITESAGVVDARSLNAVLAGTFLKSYTGLRVYNPEQFVPEYDIGIGDERSFYETVARLRAADAFVDYFLNAVSNMPTKDQNADKLGGLVAAAKIVNAQLRSLSFSIAPDPIPDTAAERVELTEFRYMVRAEKLDRFMKADGAAKAGVIKVRLLSSGGSRRESRNLILGNKTDYSGSAVIEVSLYDIDGTMRLSEVFSHHTGFRKFRTGATPTP